MKIRNDISLSVILALGDILALNLGFIFTYWLRFESGLFAAARGVPHIGQYFQVLPILTVILIFLMRSDKLYSVRSRLSIIDEFFTMARSITVGMLLFMAGTFLYREYSFSRGMLILAWFVLITFIGSWRFFINRMRFLSRKRKGKTKNLVIIGSGPMAKRLIGHISEDPHWDYKVMGVVEAKGFSAITDLAGADAVILTETSLSRDEIMKIILECEKRMIEFHLVSDLLSMVTTQVDMRTIDGVPLLGLKESPLGEGYNRFLKRVMDIVLSGIAIVVLSPIFVIIAVMVKLNSPGPVFYLQKRVGEDGSRFAMIKFRTMINNAEKGTGPVWTKKDDPRRTKIGTFLRRTNLDELPQILNVLKGEMSLVGPRPERPHFVGKFKEDIPRYMARHKIKSGMTGWAQVNGLRGNTSIEERTKYDLYYIENWSLAFDLRIMFMSVFAMKNAY